MTVAQIESAMDAAVGKDRCPDHVRRRQPLGRRDRPAAAPRAGAACRVLRPGRPARRRRMARRCRRQGTRRCRHGGRLARLGPSRLAAPRRGHGPRGDRRSTPGCWSASPAGRSAGWRFPFGSYDRRVLARLRRSGVQCAFTSDGGHARPGSWLQNRTRACITTSMPPHCIGCWFGGHLCALRSGATPRLLPSGFEVRRDDPVRPVNSRGAPRTRGSP